MSKMRTIYKSLIHITIAKFDPYNNLEGWLALKISNALSSLPTIIGQELTLSLRNFWDV